jgi:hypothetical protein
MPPAPPPLTPRYSRAAVARAGDVRPWPFPSFPSIASEKTLADFPLHGQSNYEHITDVNNSKRSETADPDRRERAARPRGRPPLSAEEAKRSPLTIRATKAEKDELLRAGKAAGRSLAEEIKFRLGAVRARPATEGEDDFEQILAGLDQVMDLAIDLQIALDEIENWVYFSIIALRKATGAGGAKLMWDEAEEKFIPRPADLPPRLPPDVEPEPPKPKPKSQSLKK